MKRRASRLAIVVGSVLLSACGLVPLEVPQSLEAGERIPLRAAYWVPPDFRAMDRQFPVFLEGVGCGIGRTCADERRVFPNGIAAVAHAVFVESHEVSTLEAAYEDPNADVVMAPELNAVSPGSFARPLMIRVLWRVWAKDRSVLWLDTITSTVSGFSMTRNGRAVAFNQCTRAQFQQAATAMRSSPWWRKLVPRPS